MHSWLSQQQFESLTVSLLNSLFNKTVPNTSTPVDKLPEGTKIKLSVTALINLGGSILKGEEVSLVSYTSKSRLMLWIFTAYAG